MLLLFVVVVVVVVVVVGVWWARQTLHNRQRRSNKEALAQQLRQKNGEFRNENVSKTISIHLPTALYLPIRFEENHVQQQLRGDMPRRIKAKQSSTAATNPTDPSLPTVIRLQFFVRFRALFFFFACER